MGSARPEEPVVMPRWKRPKPPQIYRPGNPHKAGMYPSEKPPPLGRKQPDRGNGPYNDLLVSPMATAPISSVSEEEDPEDEELDGGVLSPHYMTQLIMSKRSDSEVTVRKNLIVCQFSDMNL